MNLAAIANAVALGAIFSLVAAGLYTAFRIARFPDLTCDGSYALGACLTAVLISAGVGAIYTLLVSAVVGFVAGLVTGSMYTKLRFPPVICGILVMTAAYSVNLIMMGGRPNIPIRLDQSLFAKIEQVIRTTANESLKTRLLLLYPLLLIVIATAICIAMYLLFRSNTGLRWRALGINANTARRNGVDVSFHLPLILGTANSLIALAGSLFVHHQRFADVNMGTGIIMVGLASLFMGQGCEAIHGRLRPPHIGWQMAWMLVNALLYQLIVSVAYDVGLPTSYFNLVTAGLVFLALLSPTIRSAWSQALTRE